MTPSDSAVSTRAWPAGSWWSALVVVLSLCAIVLQIGFVLPWLSPAGHGLSIDGDPLLVGSGDRETVMPRPPSAVQRHLTSVRAVREQSPAATAGLRAGDRILAVRAVDGQWIDLAPQTHGDVPLRAWRESYWLGPRGALELRFAQGHEVATATLERPAVGQLPPNGQEDWIVMHGGRIAMAM